MIINVKVKPNSREQVVEKKDSEYTVKLKSVPEDGKANIELLKLLKKYFGREVKIKSGFTSRKKRVEVLE
jgi:uncharacterized protein (TIGR00251 family)